MDTNVHYESTEYTEDTESLADVGHRSEDAIGNIRQYIKEDMEGLRLLGGFHTLRVEISSRKT